MSPFHSSKTFLLFLALALALILCVQGQLGRITCENLNPSTCAFAVSSSGTRCVLEKRVTRGGQEVFSCHASEIKAENPAEWVETDECLYACGLSRDTVGISSDSLMDPRFVHKLCSPQCYQGCRNIVDLYFNLAAGEGLFLPKLCQVQKTGARSRRSMDEIRSSGAAAAGPGSESMEMLASSPTQSEQSFASGLALSPL